MALELCPQTLTHTSKIISSFKQLCSLYKYKKNSRRGAVPRKKLGYNRTRYTCSKMYKYTVLFTVWLDLLPSLYPQSVIVFLCLYICDSLCAHGHMFTCTNTYLTHPPYIKPDVRSSSSCMMWKAVAAHPDVSRATGQHLVDRAG